MESPWRAHRASEPQRSDKKDAVLLADEEAAGEADEEPVASPEALAVSAALRERGILVTAIRPPTVAEGTARLRIALSAAHSLDDVGELAAALNEVLAR